MYRVRATKRFEKDLKLCKKRGFDMQKIRNVILLLQETGTLPPKYKPHKLVGKYVGKWECHIESDWLLVWEQHDEELLLICAATGTHSDLF